MKTSDIKFKALKAVIMVMAIASAPVYAEKPDWAGGGKDHGSKGQGKDKDHGSKGQGKDKDHGSKGGGKQQQPRDGDEASISFRFGSTDTRIIRDYYGGQAAKGNCPPGLAKKGNGCQPPGQAKKWSRGRPLPSDVRYYDIPNELRIRLPAPPLNHRYVQVAGDILLIAIGTSIVVDAMEDILR
jgi:Ni/Co efflux regulator RcnB